MGRLEKVVKIIPVGQWGRSRDEQRRYWLSRPAVERVHAGRRLCRKMYWWLHGTDLPRHMEKVVRPFHHQA